MENSKKNVTGAQPGTKRVDTRKLTTLAMLAAISFVVVYLSKLIPVNVAGFLSFDMKDVVITIGGFIYGPAAAAGLSLAVSLVEMVTISDTGFIGLLMNVLSTCAFACTASFIYKRTHTQKGAVIGLASGTLTMTVMMLLWNYIVTPFYMHIDRALVVSMLLPVFMPFNLVKACLNSALTVLIYKPMVTALRRAHLIPASEGTKPTPAGRTTVIVLAALLLVTCVLLALALAHII